MEFLKDNSKDIKIKVDSLETCINDLSNTVEKIQPQINKINQGIPKTIKEAIQINNNTMVKIISEAIFTSRDCNNKAVLNKAIDKIVKDNKLEDVTVNYQI